MSKYIALGMIIAVIASQYSHDPIGEMIKGIFAGIFCWLAVTTFQNMA